jgi:hypothetical protein
MHCPSFSPHQSLAEWLDCRLEMHCPQCGRVVFVPVQMIRARVGDVTFAELVPRLRCSKCGGLPEPIYLLAGFHRTFCFGAPPDWAVELRPPSQPLEPPHRRASLISQPFAVTPGADGKLAC